CLQLSDITGGHSELLRVNGAQAALHFVRRAEVSISNALTYFGSSGCRRRDFVQAFQLGIWPVFSIEEIVRGRRLPLLMKIYLQRRIRLRDEILVDRRAQDGLLPRRAE